MENSINSFSIFSIHIFKLIRKVGSNPAPFQDGNHILLLGLDLSGVENIEFYLLKDQYELPWSGHLCLVYDQHFQCVIIVEHNINLILVHISKC